MLGQAINLNFLMRFQADMNERFVWTAKLCSHETLVVIEEEIRFVDRQF